MYFDEKLKNLREKNGLSLEELAKKLNIDERILDSLETGFRDPSEKDLQKIADFFSVKTEELADDQPVVNAFSVLFGNNDSSISGSLAMAAGFMGNKSLEKIINQIEQKPTQTLSPIVQKITIISSINPDTSFEYSAQEIHINDLPQGEYIALKMPDDGMHLQGIDKGDILVIHKTKVPSGKIALVIGQNKPPCVGTIYNANDITFLQYANTSCQPTILETDDIILGQVVEVRKNLL